MQKNNNLTFITYNNTDLEDYYDLNHNTIQHNIVYL